ncbi:MAG TPA: phospholipase D-like domain-containing protein [Nocardioides sp.]|uniref:phospholipase D-like domain-containing protein n=1 Tax=Nocardioides sp. TaxID=35761 RepID=UPI002D0342F9|nr:phospholipase D-like domain-containing protein [Nocardioides sp.]HTW15706.1 phospholipase D-like domain-containing protein [Nocardioides sp.]
MSASNPLVPARSRSPRGTVRARLAVLVVAVVAAALIGPIAAAPITAPAQAAERKGGWRPTPGVKFNTPRVGGERQFRLEQQVIAAIRKARKGSTIKMVMFSFDRTQVADALIEARRKRKVHVQVIVNGHELPAAQKKLRSSLGSKRSRKSFFYQCKASCRGQGDVQHSKFVLFSHTGTAKNVVMLGSLNMKLNGAENQWNDLLTLNNKRRLYATLNTVYNEMRRDRLAKHPYLRKSIGKFGLFVLPFPRDKAATKRTRWTPTRDPISRLLAPVKCLGARTDTGRTIIRVNMHAWDGDRGVMIANRLRDLYAKGCDVKIMVGYAGGRVRDVFARPTGRGLMPVRSTGFDTDEDGEIDLYSHTKILLVNGNYDGERGRKMVVTGSSNFQNGGQYGDELILRVFENTLYRSYADNWGMVWRSHTHGFSWGGAAGVPDGAAIAGRWMMPRIYADDLGTNSPEWRNE